MHIISSDFAKQATCSGMRLQEPHKGLRYGGLDCFNRASFRASMLPDFYRTSRKVWLAELSRRNAQMAEMSFLVRMTRFFNFAKHINSVGSVHCCPWWTNTFGVKYHCSHLGFAHSAFLRFQRLPWKLENSHSISNGNIIQKWGLICTCPKSSLALTTRLGAHLAHSSRIRKLFETMSYTIVFRKY